MKMYYEDDVDASIVADKTIAVMGYGSQGRGQSRNMADSGLNVIIGPVHPGRKLLMTA